jgi:hypothetical protein
LGDFGTDALEVAGCGEGGAGVMGELKLEGDRSFNGKRCALAK